MVAIRALIDKIKLSYIDVCGTYDIKKHFALMPGTIIKGKAHRVGSGWKAGRLRVESLAKNRENC